MKTPNLLLGAFLVMVGLIVINIGIEPSIEISAICGTLMLCFGFLIVALGVK